MFRWFILSLNNFYGLTEQKLSEQGNREYSEIFLQLKK